MATKPMKDVLHHISWRKCILKQDTTTQLLECPKCGTLTTLNANKDLEPQELSYIAGGNVTWYNYFGI